MKINRENYEAWFLDYIEGRLSPEQVEELMAFLELHVDLKEELDSFENVQLEPENPVVFDQKEKLKKKSLVFTVGLINERNYTDYFIADMEHDLDYLHSSMLKEFLDENPQLEQEYRMFYQTRVTPDFSIVYDRKESLRKPVVIPWMVFFKRALIPVSVAASIAILVAVYVMQNERTTTSGIFAERGKIKLDTPRKVKSESLGKKEHQKAETIGRPVEKITNPIIEIQDNQKQESIDFMAIIQPSSLTDNSLRSEDLVLQSNLEYIPKSIHLPKATLSNQSNEEKYITLSDFALISLKKFITPVEKRDKILPGDKKITLWDLADAGVSKLNSLTGANVSMTHQEENGKYTLALGSVFEISGTLGKEK